MPVRNKPSKCVQSWGRTVVASAPKQTVPPGHGSWNTASVDSFSRLVLEAVGEGIICVDSNGLSTYINPAAVHMTGWTSDDLIGKPQHSIVHHSHADGSAYPIEECRIYGVLRSGHTVHNEEEVFWRRDGTSFPVSYTSTPIFTDGTVSGAVVNFQDISERVRHEQWQVSKNRIFEAIATRRPLEETLPMLTEAYIASSPGQGIAVLLRDAGPPEKLCLAASSGLSEPFKFQLNALTFEKNGFACSEAACTGDEVFSESLPSSHLKPPYVETFGPDFDSCAVLPMNSESGQVLGVVAFLVKASASRKLPESPESNQPVWRAAEREVLRGIRGLAQIAVENRKLHYDLIHQAQHDRLTGLPNWMLMEDRLDQALRAADRTGTRVAICSIDIDRLRRINENYGHTVGDELLRLLAERFLNSMRNVDTLARQGGDEFLVMLPDIAAAADADSICRRLLAAASAPFLIGQHTLSVTVNIGISIYPDHAKTPESLVQNADTALEFAKAKGQAKLQLYRPDLGEKVRQIAARETALRTALERNELYLMYQPLYDSSRQIHGFEALLRWQHPELGLIPPDQFIPIAEDTGLILPIGDWVLKEACRQAMSWDVKSLANTKIFVNVSALQLGQVDFTHSVSEALRLSGLAPARLELEVTESLIVPSFKKATARLQPLKDLGVSIAIDDFGTGHSSFSVLHNLPVSAIKVDRSFVSRIDKDTSGLSTVRAIIGLAQQLGMKTVGEGVETEAQFKLLHEMQCDYFQGYLLSKPLTAEAARLHFGEALQFVARKNGELPKSA